MWVRMLLVLAFASLLFCGRLGERSLWSEEVRWAEIPREMLLNGDYFQPTINGKSYYDKPLGSYWLVLVASWLTGGLDETSARLLSALSGLLAVALTMLIARRLYEERTALLAGIILASSYGFVFWSRTASADAENVAGVLAALWWFLRNEQNPRGWWTLGLWLVMALTSLTKGLLGFVLPVLVLGVYASLTPAGEESPRSWRDWLLTLRERNRWLCNGKTFLAVPLAGLVYFAPFLVSVLLTDSTAGLEMVFRENIRRFYDPVNHQGPIYLYLGVIFLLLAPWSLLLPAALVQAHADWRRQRFALVYFWGVFLFFTIAASRRSYYILPILPAGALLVAYLLTLKGTFRYAARLLLGWGFTVLAVVWFLSIAAACYPLVERFIPMAPFDVPKLPNAWAYVLAWLCSGFFVVKASASYDPNRIARAFAATACCYMAYFFLCCLPALEVYRTQQPFADAVKTHLGAAVGDVVLYHNREIIFYLGRPKPLAEYDIAEDLKHAIAERKVRWLILRRRDWDRLRLDARVVVEETTNHFVWEQADGKLLLVEITR